MIPRDVKAEIRELEAVRRAGSLWRWGTLALTLAITVGGVALMNQAVQGLIRPGPKQEQFVSAVNANLQTNIVPQVQTLATRTLTESQPIVQEEITKLNARVPEVADVAMKQLNLLQTELPEKSATVLNETFGKVLQDRKAKIKEMFPQATEAQIDTFIANMSDQGGQSLSNVTVRLFDRHIEAMSAISDDVERIRVAEAPNLKDEIPTWQMGILLFDIARSDMGDFKFTKNDKTVGRAGAQSLDEKNAGISGTGLEKTDLKVDDSLKAPVAPGAKMEAKTAGS